MSGIGIAILVVCGLLVVNGIAHAVLQERRRCAAERAMRARQAEADRAREQEQARRQQEQARKRQEREAAQAQKRQEREAAQVQKRQEREAAQAAEHAAKVARAAELAELAERRLAAEREIAKLRQEAQKNQDERHETIPTAEQSPAHECVEQTKPQEERPETIPARLPFAGQQVAFTGRLKRPDGTHIVRADAVALVRSMGGKAYDDMHAGTTILVVGDRPGMGKLDKADEWIGQVRKITPAQFWEMAGIAA